MGSGSGGGEAIRLGPELPGRAFHGGGEFGHDPKGEGEPWKGLELRTCWGDPFGITAGVGEEGLPTVRLVLVSWQEQDRIQIPGASLL